MAGHAIEIERKWLVKDLPKLVGCKKEKTIQGYTLKWKGVTVELQHESMLGVHFKTSGAFPFLRSPATELADAYADWQTCRARQLLSFENVCALSARI